MDDPLGERNSTDATAFAFAPYACRVKCNDAIQWINPCISEHQQYDCRVHRMHCIPDGGSNGNRDESIDTAVRGWCTARNMQIIARDVGFLFSEQEMKEIKGDNMVVLCSGCEWEYEITPCSKDAIPLLERNERVAMRKLSCMATITKRTPEAKTGCTVSSKMRVFIRSGLLQLQSDGASLPSCTYFAQNHP
eukprot:3938010-Rhodomonas_salina.2